MKNSTEKSNLSTGRAGTLFGVPPLGGLHFFRAPWRVSRTLAFSLQPSLRGPPRSSRPPCLNLASFRGYPRLTAPNRGKTRLFAPNRTKNFSGGSRASIRGCATEPATRPQHPATSCTNSHQLARFAPTCAEKKFAGCRPGPPTRRTGPVRRWACRLASNCPSLHQLALTCAKKYFCQRTANAFPPLFRVHSRDPRALGLGVPPSGGLRVLRGSVVGLPNPNPNLNLNRRAPLRPHVEIANRKSSFVHRLALTPWSQTKPIVANCRRSKIRPKTYTLSLNTQLMERGQPVRFWCGDPLPRSPWCPREFPQPWTLEFELGTSLVICGRVLAPWSLVIAARSHVTMQPM